MRTLFIENSVVGRLTIAISRAERGIFCARERKHEPVFGPRVARRLDAEVRRIIFIYRCCQANC